jgi:hypothetical protein
MSKRNVQTAVLRTVGRIREFERLKVCATDAGLDEDEDDTNDDDENAEVDSRSAADGRSMSVSKRCNASASLHAISRGRWRRHGARLRPMSNEARTDVKNRWLRQYFHVTKYQN